MSSRTAWTNGSTGGAALAEGAGASCAATAAVALAAEGESPVAGSWAAVSAAAAAVERTGGAATQPALPVALGAGVATDHPCG